MNKYIVRAIKDIGITMEGTMHIEAESRRKCKKLFRKQNKNWQIIDIKTKEIDGIIQLTPDCQLEIDRTIFA